MRLGTPNVLKDLVFKAKSSLGLAFLVICVISVISFSNNAEAQDRCVITQVTDTLLDNFLLIDQGPSIDDSGLSIGYKSRQNINGLNPSENNQVFIQELAISELLQVTNVNPGNAFNAAISGNGQYLAFESANNVIGPNPGAGQQLYLFNRATTVITAITTNAVGDADGPAINEDGTIVSFRSNANINGGNPDGNQEMYFWSAATNTITQITNTIEAVVTDGAGISSVDAPGNLISFFSRANINGNNPDRNQEAYLYNVNTAVLTQVTNTTIGDTGITWLNGPGTLMVLASNANIPGGDPDAIVNFPSPLLNTEIYVYDVATGVFTQITFTSPGERSSRPQISADSQFVSFDSDANIGGGNPDGNREVYRYNMATGQTTQITNSAGESIEAAISGDGQRIVFESTGSLTGGNPDGNEEVYLATCVVANVPTLSEWGLIAMAALLGIVAFIVIRRRQVTA